MSRTTGRGRAKPSARRRRQKTGTPVPRARGGPRTTPPEGEDDFRLLVASVRDYAIILLDLQGRICSWNEGARLIKGYQPEEIIGESMLRFYTEPDRRRRHPAQLL